VQRRRRFCGGTYGLPATAKRLLPKQLKYLTIPNNAEAGFNSCPSSWGFFARLVKKARKIRFSRIKSCVNGYALDSAKEKEMADEKIVTVALSKLAAELAEKHEMSKKATTELLNAFVDLTVKNLKKGHKVRITGLGIFQVRKRPARMGRNPATGEQIKIKASKKLAFRAAKEVKDAI
jgi:DNA-binding protein HU-beta